MGDITHALETIWQHTSFAGVWLDACTGQVDSIISMICAFLARAFTTRTIVLGYTLNIRSNVAGQSIQTRLASIRRMLLSHGTLTRIEDKRPQVKWQDATVVTEFVLLHLFKRSF